MGFPANEMLRGELSACCSNCFYPFRQIYFVCYQLSFHIHNNHHQGNCARMIPDAGEFASTSSSKDDVMLAGYRECATEALNWLLGLGYEPGHPLVRSLAAHLTKKQAYLEKLDLERFLIDATLKESGDESGETCEDLEESRYEACAFQIKNNPEIQRALVDAVFKGCDLQYVGAPP